MAGSYGWHRQGRGAHFSWGKDSGPGEPLGYDGQGKIMEINGAK